MILHSATAAAAAPSPKSARRKRWAATTPAHAAAARNIRSAAGSEQENWVTILEKEPSFFLKYRYWILSLIVFILAFLHLLFGGIDPRSDFWEHTAVIRELATHPFYPNHPQFLLNVQHPFFSPFSLGIAWIVIITGLPSATVLTIFSFINLAFFLFCLKLFTDSLLNKRASFYVLLFILLLWGYRPWLWSSFFNLDSFFCTFSYPSFFCISLTFLSFYIYTRILLYNKMSYYILLLLISIFILITHPFTAIFLYIGLISLLLYYCNLSQYIKYLLLISLIMSSFIISFAWPYFPLYRLISSNSSEFSYLSYELYRYFPIRIFPALAGVPLIVLRLRKNYFDPLGLMFIGLSSLYLYGFISENYNYGRQISYIVIILQMCIADWVAAIETRYLSGGYNKLLTRYFNLGIIAFSIMIIGTLVMHGYSYIIHWKRNYSYHNFVFLSGYTSSVRLENCMDASGKFRQKLRR